MVFKTIKELCDVVKGNTPISKAVAGEFPLVVTAEERKTNEEFQFDTKAVIIPLVSSTGHGHASLKRIHYQEGKFAVGTILCAVIPKDEKVLNAKFLYYYLNLVKERELVSRMRGMANVTLSMTEIKKVAIPVLSIKEQLDFVEFYEKIEKDSKRISSELSHQLEIITDLRQSFLREAMQGKLVSNKTKDGSTGADLLEGVTSMGLIMRSLEGKREKKITPVTDDGIPFDIPENWVWCRLGEIINYADNLNIQKIFSPETLINYVDIDSIDNQNYIIKEPKKKKVNELSSRARRVLKKDYIVYSTVRPYLKNIAIIKENLENYIGSTGFVVFKTIMVKKEYVFYFLLNPDLNKDYEDKMIGFNSPSITNRMFEETLIPLPPLEIQIRIVEKLDELKGYCDQLEASVRESMETNELLLQQVLREALEVKV